MKNPWLLLLPRLKYDKDNERVYCCFELTYIFEFVFLLHCKTKVYISFSAAPRSVGENKTSQTFSLHGIRAYWFIYCVNHVLLYHFLSWSQLQSYTYTSHSPYNIHTYSWQLCHGKLPYLCSQKLFGFIDGTKSIPSKMLHTNSTHIPMSNLAYDFCFQQDQLILRTLICSLSEPILTNINGLETSRDVWLTLEKMLSTSSSNEQYLSTRHTQKG